MTTYELTVGTKEEFETAKAQLISDFIQQVAGAEVTNQMLGKGKIVSCLNICNNLESLIFTVHYDLDETKNYGAAVALASGSLKFIDTSLVDIWDAFVEEQYKLKTEYNKAAEEAQRREKEAQKLEKKRKDNEKKMAGLKASAEKEIETLISREKKITKADEFYYALGWIAAHVGTISAKMPDYLESAFIKHFGDVEHTVVDSTKVGPSGYTSQWRLSMEASLKKPDTVPSILADYLSQNGKKLSKTSFVWSLVDDYGFKFGKKQDTLDIMRCVPIEYVPMFNEGLKA